MECYLDVSKETVIQLDKFYTVVRRIVVWQKGIVRMKWPCVKLYYSMSRLSIGPIIFISYIFKIFLFFPYIL